MRHATRMIIAIKNALCIYLHNYDKTGLGQGLAYFSVN